MTRRTVFGAEHDAFRLRVREFIASAVMPEYPAWEAAGRPSREFWRLCGEAGILGIGVPASYGGLPGSTFTWSAVVTEEIQREFLAIGGLRVQTDICMPYFLKYASREQKERWLPRLVSGSAVAALAMSEPGVGSDVKAMRTRAVRDGDHYVVNGAKTFISNGAAADILILAVKTDPAAGRNGISLLVFDTEDSSDGFRRGRSLDKLGLKAQDLAELSFDGLRVPTANLLGEENRGFTYLTANLAQERLSIAVNSQAAAVAALGHTAELLRGGEAGSGSASPATGARPGQHARFELAACEAEARAGQALVDQALLGLEAGELTAADAAVAKLYCTELQGRVAARCLDVAGPEAFTVGHRLGRACLDGRVSRVYGGTSEVMKTIIGKEMAL